MEEKLKFVFEHKQGASSMTELCRRYEISRETGYFWLRRYQALGWEGLVERDRAAQRHPNQTPREIERRIIELRQAHMRWGPRKLKQVLERDQPGRAWPSRSTIGALLQREGLVVVRKRRWRTAPYQEPLAHADGPNRVWCADFKGWFRTGDGERIDPLTISDAYSRYLLRCQAVEKMDASRVQAIFEAAFREYGMPSAIRTDNGAPFASHALAGLSRLAVWWIRLGIVPERIAAGHPEQNGRHERMHRTLQEETAQPPAANRRQQQRAMDRFREEYNHVRPHEALEMKTPAAVYHLASRPFPDTLPEIDYPDTMRVFRVKTQGGFRWKKQDVFLSGVLWGESIGLLPIDDRWYRVYFSHYPIGQFDSRQLRVLPLPKGESFCRIDAGEGEASPSPAPHPLDQESQKVSGMPPV